MSHEALGLSESQWETLKQGPMQMLAYIGGADSVIDSAEWSALIQAVAESERDEDQLVHSVMTDLSSDLQEDKASAGEQPPLAAFEEIRDILKSQPGEGLGFRVALMDIGVTIADASGGQFLTTYHLHHAQNIWVPTPGTSPSEESALHQAAYALGLTSRIDVGGSAA